MVYTPKSSKSLDHFSIETYGLGIPHFYAFLETPKSTEHLSTIRPT